MGSMRGNKVILGGEMEDPAPTLQSGSDVVRPEAEDV